MIAADTLPAVAEPLPQPAAAVIRAEEYDRRRYIGGSDIASILGVQPPGWRTALAVWERKTAPDAAVELTEGEVRKRLARGQVVEPLVAGLLESMFSIRTIVRSRRYADPEVDYFAAEIDAEVPFSAVAPLFDGRPGAPTLDRIDGDEPVNIEIKTVHPFAASQWGGEGTDEIPIHYAAQIQWGLGVRRRRFAICAALFGADSLVLYPVVIDEELVAEMRDQARRFWLDYVLAGTPPPPMNRDDCQRLWPEHKAGASVEADANLLANVRTLAQVRDKRKAYEGGEEGIDLLIREAMRDAETLTHDGEVIATLKAQNTTSIDQAKLKAEFPDAYKACLRVGRTRVLRLKD